MNIKVDLNFLKEETSEYFLPHYFKRANKTLFYVSEEVVQNSKYAGFETKYDENTEILSILSPVLIFVDDEDNFIKTELIHDTPEAFKNSLIYSGYRNLFTTLRNEHGKINTSYNDSILPLVKRCIQEQALDYSGNTYLNYEIEILDTFIVTGKIATGYYEGTLVFINNKIVEKYSHKDICELPNIHLAGELYIEDDEDEIDTLEAFLEQLPETNLYDYVLKAL